jgi:hypothetical protein
MMKKDRNNLAVLAFTVWGCILLWGCPVNPEPADSQTTELKEQPMQHDSAVARLHPAVPQIDRHIPAKFDTATFGLG